MKKLLIDIDSTVMTQGSPNDYSKTTPLPGAVEAINKLYNEGYEIYFHTARHFMWFKLTEDQLKKYGFKYTGLVMNKPSGDLYIDDKSLHFDGDWQDTLKKIEERVKE